MPIVSTPYKTPSDLLLGIRSNTTVPEADQQRQRQEVVEILHRLQHQPGVILADEVGMGKTFVALAVAYSIAMHSRKGPVILMVPGNLVDKWEQDLRTFCDLYLDNRIAVRKEGATKKELIADTALRYEAVRHSVDLLKLLDDAPRERCHLIFLAQGSMGRKQSDKWVRLALIAETLRRHARGKAKRLIKIRKQIHRFLGRLLWAGFLERRHDWGDQLWQALLRSDPSSWMRIYNESVRNEARRLTDDPVPKAVSRKLRDVDLSDLAEALKELPIRARGGDERIDKRLSVARTALREVEDDLWKKLLANPKWRSPLLVMDEAHHLKNPGTALARRFQLPDSDDLQTGDGAMARAFDRMLFLTATPFQLGHHELVRVLERFGDVRWSGDELGSPETFSSKLVQLGQLLTESQRNAIRLQKSWSRLRPEDCGDDLETWWSEILGSPTEDLSSHQRAVLHAFRAAKESRDKAQTALRPWIVRHNKGALWAGSDISRRKRLPGAGIANGTGAEGLPVPTSQLLPFYLAARSAVSHRQDVLGEALCSSYEAFRHTRDGRKPQLDEQENDQSGLIDLTHARWYLDQFDQTLEQASGSIHPKIHATVNRVAALWEAGEKVLVFAYYRQTCRALRIHISREIENRINARGMDRLRQAGADADMTTLSARIEKIQDRFFDKPDSPGRRAMDAALDGIVAGRKDALNAANISAEKIDTLTNIMRRFLRVGPSLVRFFPIEQFDSIPPEEAVELTLNGKDGSNMKQRDKFDGFIGFLCERCSPSERAAYLDAAESIETGLIGVEDVDTEGEHEEARVKTLANVQVVTGGTKRDTRARLMRTFNTPFFPDIMVCSEVMGEGVDLQRDCRHVIHHDLAWNPSAIEQRTGRIDRLGCKANECRQPIMVYLPYLAGASDERQFRVMSDREQWFRIVMGQEEVARLITPEKENLIPLPSTIADQLNFSLELGKA